MFCIVIRRMCCCASGHDGWRRWFLGFQVTHALQYLKVLTATGDRASYSVKKWHKVLE